MLQEPNFSTLTESSKRKRTQTLRDSTQTDEIAHAATMKLKEDKKGPAAKVMKRVLEASPRTVNMIFTAVEKIKKTDSGNLTDGSPKPFTDEEGVAYLIDYDLTKDKYKSNRKQLNQKNCRVLPSYEKVSAYKVSKHCPLNL